jgi:uncharacterized protein (TIGR04255 family)
MNKWPTLNKPPVVVALFQIRFRSSEIKLNDFLKYDHSFRNILPNRNNNINVGINLEGSSIPLGISKISATSDATIDSYIYFSNDQKVKLEISNEAVTFIDERPYKDWEFFKNSVLDALLIMSDLLKKVEIYRTSIRFINRFILDNFDTPQDYFNTLISTNNDKELPYPILQYGFRLIMDIPNSDVHSIVNQQVENIRTNLFAYTFDIDVLDKQNLFFDKETISIILENLRSIKNNIFFSNVTQKTIDLCN